MLKRKPQPVELVFCNGDWAQVCRHMKRAPKVKSYLRCEKCGVLAEHTVNLYTPEMQRMSYCQGCYQQEYDAGNIDYVGANKVLRRDKWDT